MDNEDKELCKKMIRQAIKYYRKYDHHHVASYSEKQLVWDGMEAVLDWMPISTYRRYQMHDYCERMMSFLLEL